MSQRTVQELHKLRNGIQQYKAELEAAAPASQEVENHTNECLDLLADVTYDIDHILIPAALRDQEATDRFQRRLAAVGFYLSKTGFYDWSP